MEIIKKWWTNLSIYSTIGLIIAFLALGGYIKINLFFSLVLLGSAITSCMFIVTRIFKFKYFK